MGTSGIISRAHLLKESKESVQKWVRNNCLKFYSHNSPKKLQSGGCANNSENSNKSKQGTSIHDLCLELPMELHIFLKYAHSLLSMTTLIMAAFVVSSTKSRQGMDLRFTENDFTFNWDGSAFHFQEQLGNMDGKQDIPLCIHSKHHPGWVNQFIVHVGY